MNEFLSLHEPQLRLAAFGGVLLAMALWELFAPRRRLSSPRWHRWSTNLLLSAGGTLLLRVAVPLLAVGVALEAERAGFGLFNWLGTPWPLALVLSFLALDLIVYGQHVLFHLVPLFWRLHRVHHADTDIDVTTGIRFHPFEILASMGIKMGVVALLGAPAAAVILFEIVLNATAMFNHANIKLPQGVDRLLRLVIVTPDMHRVHHSVRPEEHNRNFGFNLSVWDRLFSTYRAEPREGHEKMQIGLAEYPAPYPQHLGWSLWLPFAGRAPRRERHV